MCLDIFLYSGSTFNARSVVSIIGGFFFPLICASGTNSWAAFSFGVHWYLPAGLFVSSQWYSKRFSKKPISHSVGLLVHAPSSPLVIVSAPFRCHSCFSIPGPADG